MVSETVEIVIITCLQELDANIAELLAEMKALRKGLASTLDSSSLQREEDFEEEQEDDGCCSSDTHNPPIGCCL